MGNKKKYIAIIVFILLGLSIFAFAGSDDELEDKKQNGDKQQEVSGNKDTENKNDDEEKDEVVNNNKVNNTTNNKVNTVNNNKNNNSNNNNNETTTDNFYDLALEAVKKLENTLTNEDYNNANELVSKVTDTSKKEELEGRVNNAKKSILAMALVEELEGIYNDDLTIKNLTNSRTFKTSKNVEETITLVENNEVKENLLSRMLKLNRTLTDTTSPVVTGVPTNGLTNKDVTLEVADATNVTKKVLLNGQETNEFANTNTYNLEGKYEITYVDEAFNETKVEFTIDKTAPEVLSVTKSNNDKSTNQDVTVTIKFNEGVNAPEGWTKLSETEYSKVYSENGKNTVRFTDYAGNTVDVFFEVKRIDKVAPDATVETSNNGLPTNQNVIVTITANEAIYKPTGWTEVVTNKEHAFTKVYTENDDYSVEITDKAGNKSTINFKVEGIDRVAPEVLSVTKSNNDKSTNQDVTVTIKFNEGVNAPEGWTKLSETEYSKVYSENGKNTVRFTDYAGNTVDVFFEVKRIDKVAPDATVETSNNGLPTNQDVIVTITANEAIYKPTGWTEVVTNKEHAFTKVYTENGDYSVEITDKAGNKNTINFKVEGIDRTPATISVSGGTIGNNPYSKLNLKIYDASGVAKVVINGKTLPHTGKYVDINDGHAYTFIEGENVVEVTDKAGNVTTETFIKDTVAPVITAHSLVGKDPYYSQISFKLYDNNAIDYFVLNGVKYDRTDAKWSDANYQNIKKDLKDGENTIVLYDVAGNSTEYKFELDLVKPTITIKDTSESKNNIYTNISFKLSDDHLIDKFVVNGKTFDVTDNMWGDANFDAIKGALKEGTNTITLYDVAGNSSELEFEYTEASLVMSFEDLKHALTKSGTIKVLNDIVIEEILEVSNVNVVLDMNGKKFTIKDSSVDPMFKVMRSASIVFTGNGTIDLEDNYYATFIFPYGDVTIENGNYLRNSGGTNYGAFFIGISGGKGKLIINGGYFDGGYYKEGDEFNNSRNLVNISWGQYARIYGGTFVGQNPAYGDEGMALTNPNTHSGYCQGIFFEGQTWMDTEIPRYYTVTKGILSDGRPTYTVNYNK